MLQVQNVRKSTREQTFRMKMRTLNKSIFFFFFFLLFYTKVALHYGLNGDEAFW